jgi:hypothetical protein
MSNTPRKLPDLGIPVIALAITIAIGLGWWVAQREDEAPATTPTPGSDVGKSPVIPTTPPTNGGVTPPAAAPSQAIMPTSTPRLDEEKIHNWLTGFDDTNEVASAILAGWKDLSEPGKTAAAPHLMNLVPDERFESLADLLLDPATNDDVKGIIFAGMLNRSDEIKWPLIVRVMEQKNHLFSQDARNMLTVVLGKDLGDDWANWRELVKSQLLKQPPP